MSELSSGASEPQPPPLLTIGLMYRTGRELALTFQSRTGADAVFRTIMGWQPTLEEPALLLHDDYGVRVLLQAGVLESVVLRDEKLASVARAELAAAKSLAASRLGDYFLRQVASENGQGGDTAT